MSDQSPYELLGVTQESSFDEIQDARNHLMQEYSDNRPYQEAIEIAYDAILMERLRMRQEGKIKVPDRIRFPEKLTLPVSTVAKLPTKQSPEWLQRFIDTPTRRDVLTSAGIFAGLAGLSLVFPSPDGSALSVAIALGIGVNLFFISRKENKFGRAMLLTMAGLVVGLGLGALLATLCKGLLLSTGLATINNLDLAMATVATLVTFFVLWLVSSFLR